MTNTNNIAADDKTPLLCFHPCLPRHARQALGQGWKQSKAWRFYRLRWYYYY